MKNLSSSQMTVGQEFAFLKSWVSVYKSQKREMKLHEHSRYKVCQGRATFLREVQEGRSLPTGVDSCGPPYWRTPKSTQGLFELDSVKTLKQQPVYALDGHSCLHQTQNTSFPFTYDVKIIRMALFFIN